MFCPTKLTHYMIIHSVIVMSSLYNKDHYNSNITEDNSIIISFVVIHIIYMYTS